MVWRGLAHNKILRDKQRTTQRLCIAHVYGLDVDEKYCFEDGRSFVILLAEHIA